MTNSDGGFQFDFQQHEKPIKPTVPPIPGQETAAYGAEPAAQAAPALQFPQSVQPTQFAQPAQLTHPIDPAMTQPFSPQFPAAVAAQAPQPAAATQPVVSETPIAAAPGQQQYVWGQTTQSFRPVEPTAPVTPAAPATSPVSVASNAATQAFQPNQAEQPAVDAEATQAFQPDRVMAIQPFEAQAMPNAETAATQAYGASSTVSGETVAMPATQVASADDAVATRVFQPAALAASAQAQPAVIPPSIPLNQVSDEDDSDGAEPRHGGSGKKNTRKIVGIAVAVVAVIALVVAGLLWWHSNSSKASQTVALAECKVAAKQYTNAQKKLTTAISNGQTSAQTSTSDVADANTLTTLNQALQDAGNPTDTAKCDSSLNATELKSHTQELQNDASDMADKTDAINNAIKAVNTSKATADTDTLKSNLSSAISQAQGALDNSADSVADENTRTALQNAITEANTVMNGTSPSESDVNNAISKLQKAESDVTASMQAKQQADAAKQAQEEAKRKADQEAQQKADQEAQQKSQDESNNSDDK